MSKTKGVKFYKKYWEEQTEFMDQGPWAKDRIVKINFHQKYEDKLKELQFSNHSMDREDGNLTVRLKVPFNYFDLDDFESKVLDILGIERIWIIRIWIDDAYCKSTHW